MKKALLSLSFATGLISTVLLAAGPWAKHPHLKRAHEAIENAKKALAEANDEKKTEFGGHRAAAIKLLEQAQVEVKASLDWANSNAK